MSSERIGLTNVVVYPERNRGNSKNHLIQQGGVSIVYDGDGNRVFKTVAGFTTGYLVDDRNPTGYAQVLDEVQAPQISRAYVYGLEMIEQDAVNTFSLQVHTSYNVYDGHGSAIRHFDFGLRVNPRGQSKVPDCELSGADSAC